MIRINTSNMKIERIAKNQSVSSGMRVLKKDILIHTHDYFEIEFIIDGEGKHFINDTVYSLKRGCVLFLTPADCHWLKLNGELKLWNISFNGNMISEEFLKRAQKSFGYKNFFKEEELAKLEECAQLISKEIESTGHVRPLLEYILSLILPEIPEGKEKPLNKVIDYVKMYFRESPTIADAAKVACLSPAYFGNLFKNTYGVSFNTYVNRKKVECAKILLANDMNVTEACFESGFNSLSSFLKVFKKETGVAPKEYQINERRKI